MPTFKVIGEDGKPYTIHNVPSEGSAMEAVRDYLKDQADESREQILGGAIPKVNHKSQAHREGAQAPGAAQGALAVLNGLTMGFGDEAIGGAKGLYNKVTGGDFDEGYHSGRDYARGAVDAYKQEHPFLAPVADISGAMMLGTPRALAALPGAITRGVGKLGGVGRAGVASGTGAVTGGIQGAGDAESMDNIGGKIFAGATMGGLLSAGTSGVGSVFGAVKDATLPRVNQWAADRLAERRIANAFLRDERGVGQVGARMRKLGDEATIADSVGDSTRSLLDTMATLPGKTYSKTERMIRQRRQERPERMDVIPDKMSGGWRADAADEALQRGKERATGPLYERVDRTSVEITDTLAGLAERPVVQAAIARARRTAANQGRDMTGDMTEGRMPLRFWDDVKKGLDDVIYDIKRGTGPTTNADKDNLRDAIANKQQLVRELDALTTVKGKSFYKEARDAHAGPTALQSAIEDGRKALTMSAGEIKDATYGMSKSELQAYRIGAAEAMREKVGAPQGQNEMINAWVNRNTRQKMQAIFGDEQTSHKAYKQAMSTLLKEEQFKKLEGVGRGSLTARRKASEEDLDLGIAGDLAQGGKATAAFDLPGMFSAGSKLAGRAGTSEAVRDEIGRILLQRGVPAQQQLKKMEEILRSMQMGNTQAAAIQGALGGSVMSQ